MYEIFEKLLAEKGVKTADVTRATGISSTVFSEWKKDRASRLSAPLARFPQVRRHSATSATSPTARRPDQSARRPDDRDSYQGTKKTARRLTPDGLKIMLRNCSYS